MTSYKWIYLTTCIQKLMLGDKNLLMYKMKIIKYIHRDAFSWRKVWCREGPELACNSGTVLLVFELWIWIQNLKCGAKLSGGFGDSLSMFFLIAVTSYTGFSSFHLISPTGNRLLICSWFSEMEATGWYAPLCLIRKPAKTLNMLEKPDYGVGGRRWRRRWMKWRKQRSKAGTYRGVGADNRIFCERAQ